jgi:chemotaxis protein histidine kinase CheA
MEDFLKDPEMVEAVDEFCIETNQLLEELEDILEKFEDSPTETALLEKYGQVIDRIMGAAKSLGAIKIGTICEFGKIIGYKSAQCNDSTLQEIVTAFLFDTNEVLLELIKSVEISREEKFDSFDIDGFIKRLEWLKEKFSGIERSSVAVAKKSEKDSTIMSTQDLKDLLS